VVWTATEHCALFIAEQTCNKTFASSSDELEIVVFRGSWAELKIRCLSHVRVLGDLVDLHILYSMYVDGIFLSQCPFYFIY
jgi:hypothetical protein